MVLFFALLGLAIVAPAFPLLVAWLDRPRSARVTPRGQFVRHAALAGGVGIVPIGFLFILGAYGDWIALALISLLGALYGALVGAVISWLQSFRHRDRAG